MSTVFIEDAELFADLKGVHYAQRDIKNQEETIKDCHSYNALIAVKRDCDRIDRFLIYEFGAEGTSTDEIRNRDYVFKTSRCTAQIGLHMDVDGHLNPMQKERAFIDGKHNRVQGFISLGLWTYHPAARKVIRLASMEVRSERTDTISLMLHLWNKVLSEVKGESNYKFNPCGIMTDAAGANENAVRAVLGRGFHQRKKVCHMQMALPFRHAKENTSAESK